MGSSRGKGSQGSHFLHLDKLRLYFFYQGNLFLDFSFKALTQKIIVDNKKYNKNNTYSHSQNHLCSIKYPASRRPGCRTAILISLPESCSREAGIWLSTSP